MSGVGRVESLWRYPVKSMRGEELAEAFIGFPGVYGDRLFAFRSSARPAGFPYLTGREQEEMLLYRPRFRACRESRASRPICAEAEAIGPGITPLPGDPADLALEVETPTGEVLAVDDPALADRLGEGCARRPHADAAALGAGADRLPPDLAALAPDRCASSADEIGMALDKRRFRANVYLDLGSAAGSPRTAWSAAACGSAPRRWSPCSSAIRAAR